MAISRPAQDKGKIFSVVASASVGDSVEVAPDECCVVITQGQALATLPGGTHPLGGAAGPVDLVFVAQSPLMGQKYEGPLGNVVDPKTQQPIVMKASGEYIVMPSDAALLARSAAASPAGIDGFNQYVQTSLLAAITESMVKGFSSGQFTTQNIGTMVMTILAEVAQNATTQLAAVGVQIMALSSCQIQLSDMAGNFGAPAQMQLPPNPMQATENALKKKAEEMNPLNKEYSLRVDSGLLGVDIDKGGIKLDEKKLTDGVKDKVKDKITNMIITAVFILVFIIIVVVVALFIWWKSKSGSSSDAIDANWSGTSTYICTSGNNVIKGKKAKLPAVAIKASSNCKLTLDGVEIIAPTVIEADGNAVIDAKGSTLEGIIKASGNAKVNLNGSSHKGTKQPSGNGKVNPLGSR